MLVTCRTLDLTPGTDTNLILYDNDRNGINGNDDVNRAAGDLSSSVSYYVTYRGLVVWLWWARASLARCRASRDRLQL